MRITESRIRQIIREEARRVLREEYDPRLESKDIDTSVHTIIDMLGGLLLGSEERRAEIEEIYPEAGALRKELQRLQRDFDQGTAIVRPSESGSPDEFDIFLSYTSSEPINKEPIPRRLFGKMGISLDTKGRLSSAGARMRGISGY